MQMFRTKSNSTGECLAIQGYKSWDQYAAVSCGSTGDGFSVQLLEISWSVLASFHDWLLKKFPFSLKYPLSFLTKCLYAHIGFSLGLLQPSSLMFLSLTIIFLLGIRHCGCFSKLLGGTFSAYKKGAFCNFSHIHSTKNFITNWNTNAYEFKIVNVCKIIVCLWTQFRFSLGIQQSSC